MKNIFENNELRQLYIDNKKGINDYNAQIFPIIAMTGVVITGVSVIGSFINEYMDWARNVYIIVCCICCMLFIFSKMESMRKHALIGLYIEFISLFVLATYLSAGLFPDRTASSVLILFSIFPLTFIDKPQRLFLTNMLMYLIHTLFSYKYKDISIAGLDQVNGLTATIVGCCLGFFILKTRIESFDLARLLVLEKETDMLTGLDNRRKMSELLVDIHNQKKPMPDGVVMMDIDYFKKYNDTHGQGAGDSSLESFGKMIRENKWNHNIKFYRYGGEEFVAFVWDSDRYMMQDIAEQIHRCARNMELEYGNITLSVGYVHRDDDSITNIETWIQRADLAAYRAKSSGRDCVVCFNEMRELYKGQ